VNIELQHFELEFLTTPTIKNATLVEFTTEWTYPGTEDLEEEPREQRPGSWMMHFDGAFAHQGAGVGVILTSPIGDKLYYVVHLCFKREPDKVSNNIAEYEGLLAGLRASISLGVKRITIKGDSQLIINFSNKAYKPKDPHMIAYLEEVRKLEKRFLGMEMEYIPRSKNQEEDDIAK
jgi:ribonuclease HI